MAEKALEVYTKGSEAWFPDEKEGWVMGKLTTRVIADDAVKLGFHIDSLGKDVIVETTKTKLNDTKAADLPPLQNPPALDGIDDLAFLSYLHEPAVLHNIRLRYLQQNIYTYSGIVLIAMNPFAKVPLYGQDVMREYSGKRREELEPHLFAVAEEAYRSMIQDKKNQSIIVSGESGAGKTQSARYIMRYFATVESAGASSGESEVERSVLATNPIMEAFGNSKTTRNDNSSRFGKYMEILFSTPTEKNPSVRITGAKIRTYLLERSRLIFQPATERNYHIFYQLCAGAPAAERKDLGLGSWESFFYLNQGGMGTIPGVDDAAEFVETSKALSDVGISLQTQWAIFKICAALLHMGNIKIEAKRDESHIADDDAAMQMATSLLGVDVKEFKKWITKKQIITRSEKIVSNVNQYQAVVGRDSVAKFIYSMLFDWLVKVINVNLAKEGVEDNQRFIGVLDIYGFEHFKKNSFEQFCINYANEKLQQEFNAHVFKLEQEEYVAEKINWSFIDFNDNQPCIDLIEGKLGILDLLDEESRLPSGADQSLITKLYQRFAVPTQKFFEKPRFGQSAFTVKHYATDVVYDIDGFIEKNKDTVSDEQMAVLNSSAFDFLKEVIKIEEPPVSDVASPPRPGRGGASSMKKPTLGSIFKGSLVKLMETIRQTEVHYIRCIKPNMAKTAFTFEPIPVLQQLRACGVLETIRISCAGYPSRTGYEDFADRYYLLVPSNQWSPNPNQLTEAIVKKVINDDDKYQMGLTKVFFRAGQMAFLEKLRTERQRACVIMIQKNVRAAIYRRKYLRMRAAAITIQKHTRGHLARKQYKDMRETRAAIKIQKNVRAWLARKRFNRFRDAAIKIQSTYRMARAQSEAKALRSLRAAIIIQRVYRGYSARKAYKASKARMVLIQSCFRRRIAIKEMKVLKAEARSVGKLKETNYKLEGKVVELSRTLAERNEETARNAEKITHLEDQVRVWKERFEKSDAVNKGAAAKTEEGSAELRNELVAVKADKEKAEKELEKLGVMMKRRDEKIEKLEESAKLLKEELAKAKAEKSVPVMKKEDEEAYMALKKEVVVMREQMARLLAGKYRADRVADSMLAASLSPTDGPATASGSQPYPLENTKSAVNMQIEMDMAAAAAKARPRRHSFGEGAQSPVLEPPPPAATGEMTPRKTRTNMIIDTAFANGGMNSTGPMSAGAGVMLEAERSVRILEEKALEDEIIDALVTNLRIPLPSTQTVATRKEIFFPAHLIGCTIVQMLRNDLATRMLSLMTNVMKAIQNLTMKFEDDYVSAFWLSNCYELLCVVRTTRERERAKARTRPSGETGEAERALDKVLNDLDYLLIEIYHGWIKELKKRLTNMITPAVIENQSLPGYICKQSGGLWGKWGKSSSASQFTIEQLLNFLSKLSKTMRCYYMEDTMTRQILTELLRVVGVSAFNHLLMRKNFCTWKRGVQIQYNVSRLEEWCTSHGIAEATLHLQQLLQAAKLLTLNKTSPQDIETIFDVCFLLNPTQIKKLLSLYYAADFDSPLSPELLKIVASRAVLNEKSDILLLDLEQAPDFVKPASKPVDTIERFVPTWMSLPNITTVVSSAN
ncbi:P-loop containing nucleoside triphosphate hydrolase protein [Fimicolochytrium jonesii]|uniref:P-loop containing nucleoside triphosphate hydrolase protein n=1 Tax=Fimicolochytrium jonesii TaxID=1396493 RepID=UPI0022FECEAB|nr:P-loop containing nucleoside triphosphate hydrolase protein [Fimicolochytrium jonesii]KAI8826621.1 P-loop containing nucleoside triphosphate hydrolase protein [Fimicolochytrium jonesii]